MNKELRQKIGAIVSNLSHFFRFEDRYTYWSLKNTLAVCQSDIREALEQLEKIKEVE